LKISQVSGFLRHSVETDMRGAGKRRNKAKPGVVLKVFVMGDMLFCKLHT